MFVRITLDKDDDEFMPPAEEAQLSAAQIEAIRLWIERKPIPAAVAKEARVGARK
jgi:hypothetical protein